jgi:RimJ/RimL family protein N-acetyltransferase
MATKQRVLFLEGKRLYLRPVEEGDLASFRRWMNDPDIRQFLLRQAPLDDVAERKWFEAMNRSTPPIDIVLGIVLKKGDRLIGDTGIHRIDWINRNGTTGAVIGEKDCWGKGYGSEAKELILSYAFDTLNLHRINSAVLSTNPRSLAYLQKCGYRIEGRRRRLARSRMLSWPQNSLEPALNCFWNVRGVFG